MEDSAVEGWTIEAAEELLRSLKGVVSARIVAKPNRDVEEIHMLTTSDVSPKQTVRNVESALLAHYDLEVDHRCISVAESSDFGAPRPVPEPVAAVAAPAPAEVPEPDEEAFWEVPPTSPQPPPRFAAPAPPPKPFSHEESEARILFHGHRIETQRGRRLRMVVTIEWLGEIYEGETTGADMPRGRLETVASATLRAIEKLILGELGERRAPVLALDGAQVVDAFDRDYALVAVTAMTDRDSVALSGSASVLDSAERAVILATLQAADRWVRGRLTN
jgi:hypothetical protein